MIKTDLFLTPKATLSFSWIATSGFGRMPLGEVSRVPRWRHREQQQPQTPTLPRCTVAPHVLQQKHREPGYAERVKTGNLCSFRAKMFSFWDGFICIEEMSRVPND